MKKKLIAICDSSGSDRGWIFDAYFCYLRKLYGGKSIP